MQEKIVEYSTEKGYNRFHPQWFENNKLEPKSWYLELCLLHQWLRNEKELDIIITKENSKFEKIYRFSYIHKDFTYTSQTNYDTYEEALEEGILLTLKILI